MHNLLWSIVIRENLTAKKKKGTITPEALFAVHPVRTRRTMKGMFVFGKPKEMVFFMMWQDYLSKDPTHHILDYTLKCVLLFEVIHMCMKHTKLYMTWHHVLTFWQSILQYIPFMSMSHQIRYSSEAIFLNFFFYFLLFSKAFSYAMSTASLPCARKFDAEGPTKKKFLHRGQKIPV